MFIKKCYLKFLNSLRASSIATYMKDGNYHFLNNNYSKAIKSYNKACELNSGEAYAALGYMYDIGEGVKQDYTKAKDYYDKAILENTSMAFNNLGVFYEKGLGVDQDYLIASDYYKKGCALEYPLSFTNLGTFYEHGLGVSKDLQKASDLYRKGCDLGDLDGCKAQELLSQRGKPYTVTRHKR